MADPSEKSQLVRQALASINDPETGRKISKQIHQVTASENSVHATVGLTSYSWLLKDDFQTQLETCLKQKFPDHEIHVDVVLHNRPAQPIGQSGLTIKSVIAVAAGKGGVGKSTAATSLAVALKRGGSKVGLLDADVYGPSVPHLTGVRGQVTPVDNKLQPLDYDGIALMSIGFIIPPGEAVIWRGPMLHKMVTSFVKDTAWGDLDYLIIDMPPGTGDVALSLSQLLPLTGAVIVCTPQEVALIDAIKAVAMFRKVKIPVIGMIENMSSFICPDTGKRYDIFGRGGAREYAKQDKITFLGEIPINIGLRERGDSGQMAANFDDPDVAPFLEEIAYNLVRNLADQAAEKPVMPQLPVLG